MSGLANAKWFPFGVTSEIISGSTSEIIMELDGKYYSMDNMTESGQFVVIGTPPDKVKEGENPVFTINNKKPNLGDHTHYAAVDSEEAVKELGSIENDPVN